MVKISLSDWLFWPVIGLAILAYECRMNAESARVGVLAE
jgi:hypothetical protein